MKKHRRQIEAHDTRKCDKIGLNAACKNMCDRLRTRISVFRSVYISESKKSLLRSKAFTRAVNLISSCNKLPSVKFFYDAG